jgi:hypothetical protein
VTEQELAEIRARDALLNGANWHNATLTAFGFALIDRRALLAHIDWLVAKQHNLHERLKDVLSELAL